MKKRWTMRRALLVLCIASVVFALLLQTFLFHQSLRRQIRAESISDHEISLNGGTPQLIAYFVPLPTALCFRLLARKAEA